jgi:hypothetical protein
LSIESYIYEDNKATTKEDLKTHFRTSHLANIATVESYKPTHRGPNNMNIRPNLFGQGPKAGREQQGGYGRPPQPPPRDDTPMGGYQENPRGQYGGGGYNAPPAGGMPLRTAVGREPSQQPMGSGAPRRVQMRIAKVEDKNLANEYIFGNL